MKILLVITKTKLCSVYIRAVCTLYFQNKNKKNYCLKNNINIQLSLKPFR